jgi:hypothetical protein
VSFTASIDKFIAKSEARLEAVVKDAAQSTINEAQTTTGKGGFMRRDTGFLVNSGMASIGTLPVGESKNLGTQLPEWNPQSIASALLQWDLNSPFYFGWVANYARARENKDGFMRRAAQNWPQNINESVAKVKAAIK